jgi:hypothetical protein
MMLKPIQRYVHFDITIVAIIGIRSPRMNAVFSMYSDTHSPPRTTVSDNIQANVELVCVMIVVLDNIFVATMREKRRGLLF